MRKAAIFLLAASVFAQAPAPNAALAAFINTNWQRADRLRDLPQDIKNAPNLWPMAEPRERFTVGCVTQKRYILFGPELPRRRLIFAGKASNNAFLYFEYGGIGHGAKVSTFSLGPNGIFNQIAEWYAPLHVNSIEELKQAACKGLLTPIGAPPR